MQHLNQRNSVLLGLIRKKFYIARVRVQIPCATDKRVYITSTTFDKTIKKKGHDDDTDRLLRSEADQSYAM